LHEEVFNKKLIESPFEIFENSPGIQDSKTIQKEKVEVTNSKSYITNEKLTSGKATDQLPVEQFKQFEHINWINEEYV